MLPGKHPNKRLQFLSTMFKIRSIFPKQSVPFSLECVAWMAKPAKLNRSTQFELQRTTRTKLTPEESKHGAQAVLLVQILFHINKGRVNLIASIISSSRAATTPMQLPTYSAGRSSSVQSMTTAKKYNAIYPRVQDETMCPEAIAKKINELEDTHQPNNFFILSILDYNPCDVIDVILLRPNRCDRDNTTFSASSNRKRANKMLPDIRPLSIRPLSGIKIW